MSQIAKTPQNNKRGYVLRRGVANAGDLDLAPVEITSATVTFDRDTHGNRPILFNRAAGIVATLPAATGTGDAYPIYVMATFTGAASVAVANATDIMRGTAILFQDSADTVVAFNTTSTSDTVDLFETGNTTGGMIGAQLELVDLASGVWGVRYVSDAGGTEATPFAATIS